MNQYVQGIFSGILIVCLLLLNFPDKKSCVVEIGKGNVTHVLVGKFE